MKQLPFALLGCLLLWSSVRAAGSSEWPQFRGPRGDGVADEFSLPHKWSADDNVAWTIELPGRGLVISYDANGQELWRLKGMTQATPSPVAADGLLYVGSGSQGEANRPLMAIRPGAKGDISLLNDQDANDFVAWRQPRLSGYTPSPLVYRGRVYAVNDNGILQVADAKTGADVYKARVGGGGNTFSSSPLASRGRLYLLSEDGDTFVLNAGDKYEEISRNSLGEMSLATPAADADSLYVRTQTKLFRIKQR